MLLLEYHFDSKANTRQCDKTIYEKVVKGFFREGDKLFLYFGDPEGGSPGIKNVNILVKVFK